MWPAVVRRWLSRRRTPAALGRPASASAAPPADPLGDALRRLRRAVDEERYGELALAWFRVDEAKAAAVWYDVGQPPAYAAVLPEEQALAQRLLRALDAGRSTPNAVLDPDSPLLPMLRYRLLVAHLPVWTALGGRRASDAIRTGYELMTGSADVLSPYGRWLLAQAVCRAARDNEELARQTERFRMVTADHRAADGSSMAFIGGGEFILPLPAPLTRLLDQPGMPMRLDALKAHNAPKPILRMFLSLTDRSQRVFVRAFRRREQAYRNGYPWTKPPWLASEGMVFLRLPVMLEAFFIDRRPIDQSMFAAFTAERADWRPSRVAPFAVDPDTYLPGWTADLPPEHALSEPVTGISYQACRAYCAAFGKQLPTEAQWVYALIGAEVPETRHVGAESRPSISDEERALHGRRAAERGLHLMLPERLYDFDGCCAVLPWERGRLLRDPQGPPTGPAHIWRSPTARGRLPDLAGDANLTFRGVLPASRLWAGR